MMRLLNGVSIPLWCDCDLSMYHCNTAMGVRFQSHYGAIATEMSEVKLNRQTRFNPTMVRLRRGGDSNASCCKQFQSHYGAIATKYQLVKSLT